MEITTAEQNKDKRMKRTEDSLRDLWDNIRCTNIRIIGVPEEEEKKKGTEKIFEEIIVENFPNMGKEIVLLFFSFFVFLKCIYLFIFGCAGSLFLCKGFL